MHSIDECHFTTDGTVVYTYLHFTKYVSRCTLAAFMDEMKAMRNIILFEIVGYNSLSGYNVTSGSAKDACVREHVAYKVLLDHHMNKNPAFQSCTDGVPGVTRGLLCKGDYIARLKHLVKSRNKDLMTFLDTLLENKSTDDTGDDPAASKLDDAKVLASIAWDAHPALVEPLFDAGMRAIIVEYNQIDRAMMKAVTAHERTIKATNGEIGPYFKGRPGEIYAAFCWLWTALHKLGFTCVGAVQRVKQLQTAGMIEPFELVRAVKVPDARLYEKVVHLYFKQVRVYKRKEFFAVERDEVHRLFDQIEGVVERTPKEKQWWDWAFASASKRLERKLVA